MELLEKIVDEVIYNDNLETFDNEAPIDIAKAIEDLINKNKELKKENKEIRDWKYVIDNPIDLKKLSELEIIKIFGKSYIAKDKIKAKIEENKWAIEHYDCDEADYKQSQAVGAWNVLQRLLKESEI